MKIITKNKIAPSFNMVSMTDIMFLLLIFLLITVHPNSKAMLVDLPLSSNEKETMASIHITVTDGLQYYVDQQLVGFNQLYPVLQSKLAHIPDKNIVLHMDKKLSIANMVQVADIVNRLGGTVSLATEFKHEP